MRRTVRMRETLAMAIGAIRANKLRGALTTLGIIIGIVAVVLTMTAANGLQDKFRESFSAVGTDVIYVSRMPWVIVNDFFEYRNRPPLDLRSAHALEERLRGRAVVNPTMTGQHDVKYRSWVIADVMITGTTEKQIVVASPQPQLGRFLTPFDVAHEKNACVIGTDIRDAFFGTVDPVNKTLQIGRTTFRIVGVMEDQGTSFFGGPNFDRQIFIPITSYANAFGRRQGRESVDIAVKAPSQEAMASLEYEVIGEMRKIRRLRPSEAENFSINKLDTLVQAFQGVMGVVLLVGLIVTGISLFVGAVGVMNIMFVSVTERTREIGIRKALGAKPRDILWQFLFESSAICLLGGSIGIALACVLTGVVNAHLMPASVSLPILGLAVAVSVAVGIVAGVAPAWRGARLDPIDALRYE